MSHLLNDLKALLDVPTDPGPGPYDHLDWGKASLGLFAVSEDCESIILWYVGAGLTCEVEATGTAHGEDLGFEPPGSGLWVWEGAFKVGPPGLEGDQPGRPEGKWRRPADAEWARIREGACPWDARDWMTPPGRAEHDARVAAEAEEASRG